LVRILRQVITGCFALLEGNSDGGTGPNPHTVARGGDNSINVAGTEPAGFASIQELVSAWRRAVGSDAVDKIGEVTEPALFQQFFMKGQIVVDETNRTSWILLQSPPRAFVLPRTERVLSSYTKEHLVTNELLIADALRKVADDGRKAVYRNLLDEEAHDRKGIRGGIADVFITNDLLPHLGMPTDREVGLQPCGLAEDPDHIYLVGLRVDPGNYDLGQPARAIVAIDKPAGDVLEQATDWLRITVNK